MKNVLSRLRHGSFTVAETRDCFQHYLIMKKHSILKLTSIHFTITMFIAYIITLQISKCEMILIYCDHTSVESTWCSMKTRPNHATACLHLGLLLIYGKHATFCTDLWTIVFFNNIQCFFGIYLCKCI